MARPALLGEPTLHENDPYISICLIWGPNNPSHSEKHEMYLFFMCMGCLATSFGKTHASNLGILTHSVL